MKMCCFNLLYVIVDMCSKNGLDLYELHEVARFKWLCYTCVIYFFNSVDSRLSVCRLTAGILHHVQY